MQCLIEIPAIFYWYFFSILDPRLTQLTNNKISEWRRWFDTRLDDAIEAASKQQHPEIESRFHSVRFKRSKFINSFMILYVNAESRTRMIETKKKMCLLC